MILWLSQDENSRQKARASYETQEGVPWYAYSTNTKTGTLRRSVSKQ